MQHGPGGQGGCARVVGRELAGHEAEGDGAAVEDRGLERDLDGPLGVWVEALRVLADKDLCRAGDVQAVARVKVDKEEADAGVFNDVA